MDTNVKAMHIDYNDFHRLCLDALIAYNPDYKEISYIKSGNHLRVKNFDNVSQHIVDYWKKRSQIETVDKMCNGLVIDGFMVSNKEGAIINQPPKEYIKMLEAFFPEVLTDKQSQEILFKMHPEHINKEENLEKNYHYSYKSFKEIYEFLKGLHLIAVNKIH